MKVFKYPVTPTGIELPVGATILCCGVQGGLPYVWARVDSSVKRLSERKFVTVATGEEFDSVGTAYIGTFHGVEGSLVFHLFERNK